jgi:arabinogalactan oligomer / maltooligosaccharide transport system permease protein
VNRPNGLRVVLVNAALVLAVMVTLYPLLWVLKMAFSGEQGFAVGPNPWPDRLSLANFADVIGHPGHDGWLFARQLGNSLAVAAATTVIGLSFATTAAYAFSRFKFPGRRSGLGALLVTQMFPGVVMAIPLYVLLDATGLVGTLSGLTLVYATTSVPFSVFMLKGYFDTIPRELEEAATVDGASRFTIFTRIVLPLARPALAVTGLFSFMTAWNEFILASTFLSDQKTFTLPIVLQRYVGEFSVEWGRFAAGAVVVSIPVMALFFYLQRHLVGGLTAGGVKG